MSRRARREATRRQVLEAARSCFRTRGFDSSTIARIAREADVSVGTVHLHFDDKASLLAAAFHPDIEQVLTQAWATLDTDAPAIDQLLHPAHLFYRWYAERPQLGRALVTNTLFLRGPIAEEYADQVLRFVALQALTIQRGQACGELRDDLSAETGAQGFYADYFMALLSGLQGELPTVDQQLEVLEALTRARLL